MGIRILRVLKSGKKYTKPKDINTLFITRNQECIRYQISCFSYKFSIASNVWPRGVCVANWHFNNGTALLWYSNKKIQ